MKFVADGEFGTYEIEADNIWNAATATAERHVGLDCDEICRDPLTFSIVPAETPDKNIEFTAQWDPDDGLTVLPIPLQLD